MADLTYTIKAGTVNGTTEFNTIAAALTYFGGGDRMGAGAGVIAAASTLYLKIQGFLDFGGATQVVAAGTYSISRANDATSKLVIEAASNPWNGSASNKAGYSESYDGFKFGDAQLFSSFGGVTVRNLVIASQSSGTYATVDIYGGFAAWSAIEKCVIVNNYAGATASAYGLSTWGFINARNNVIICKATSATAYGVWFRGSSDDVNFDHNTVVYIGAGSSGSIGISSSQTNKLLRNNYVGGFATQYSGTFSASCVGNASAGTDTPENTTGLESIALSTTNFQNVTGGTEDLRSKSTSVLKTTGAARLTGVVDLDAYGQARTATTTVGAYAAEVAPPAGGDGDVIVNAIYREALRWTQKLRGKRWVQTPAGLLVPTGA